MTSSPSTVHVSTAGDGYDVLVGRGLLVELGGCCHEAGLNSQRIHVFEDAGVPEKTREVAAGSLGSATVTRTVLRLDEGSKTIATLERMLVEMAGASLERSDLVVVVGGGILGDVGGLAASLHRRGVRVVQCPTTLLAMVDASVGGKTAVNLRAEISGEGMLLKNAVGAFHQPSLVVADVDALQSLPPRHLRGGLAECIKHAVIAGERGEGLLHLEQLLSAMPTLLAGDPEALVSLVRASVELKAGVVAGDERELATGANAGRRALNLGHTFAHAIEGCGQTRVLVDGHEVHPEHGEAVGLGLIAAAVLAEELGLGSADLTDAIRRTVASAGLPDRLSSGPSVKTLMAAMRQDKKASGGQLRLVLPTPAGVAMRDDPGDEPLSRAWRALLSTG
ncbi:hypothetical protein AY599_23515 [Leptolyngbya valderiana BDU 20041]|nr:hypothetical protein AY599_23515 [Leptolyngbya valderiana BDU 20041]